VTRWAYARALLISVALLVELISALPERKLQRRNLERPEAVRFLQFSERALGALGFAPGRPALERAMLRGSALMSKTRAALIAPFAPFFRYTATHQQWGLFLLGTRDCFRILVDARTHDGRWVALYHALQESVPRYEAMLRYRRVRGIYNPSSSHGARPQYHGFVRALAGYVFDREPQYERVRVRMERLTIGPPGQVPRSGGFEDEVVVTRAELPLLRMRKRDRP
jgi:hypothetical protein